MTPGGADPEYELWKRVEKSSDPEDFKFFLSAYPKGKYEATARYMIRKLAQARPIPPSPGDTWTEPVTNMVFVWVPDGCFQMGDTFGDGESDEKPVHQVCLDGFWMGKTEVTQGQWKTIMGNNPSKFKSGESHPVEQVSWHDTKKFVSTLNAKSGQSFQLPSEAQWEYAARSGGEDEKYAGGDDVDQLAWYGENSGGKTHPVAAKSPNGLGLYDMSGNVYEWCEDIYDENAYAKPTGKNPVITSGGSSRVVRGGSWHDSPWGVRAAYRWVDPDYANSVMGFRLCAPQVR